MKESAEDYRNWTIELLNKIDDIDIIKKVYKFLVYLYLKWKSKSQDINPGFYNINIYVYIIQISFWKVREMQEPD